MVGAYNRDVSRRKALRKKHLIERLHPSWGGYYDNLHQYSKNKIHCSCPLCSAKTRNKGRRSKHATWGGSINYRKSDLLRQISMDQQMREEGFNAPRRHAKEWI